MPQCHTSRKPRKCVVYSLRFVPQTGHKQATSEPHLCGTVVLAWDERPTIKTPYLLDF